MIEPQYHKPKIGDVVQIKGSGEKVKVALVGLRFLHVRNLDNTRDRMIRISGVEAVPPPPPPPAPVPRHSTELDAEFLNFSHTS